MMGTMRGAILLAALCALLQSSAAGRAQECNDSSNQMELDACAGSERDKADARLAASLAEIRKRLTGFETTAAQLVDAQAAWKKFRDVECAFQTGDTVGGSIHSMLVTKCELALTLERIRQLDVYLACEEGDLMCPVPEPD